MNDLLFYYSHDDRVMLYNIIKENLESTKLTHMPLL